ncbi:MAG: UPF0149 family protein [Burkholderiales bacterium]|nr:UPF0149 family protein [Burkholderiales bacterium]
MTDETTAEPTEQQPGSEAGHGADDKTDDRAVDKGDTAAAGAPPPGTPPDGFEELAALCERLVGFDDTLHVHHVDGWLTAMAAGPVRPPTEQWLELLFGDTFERTFADPADRTQALEVLQRRLRLLHGALDAEALQGRPDDLRLDPFFDDWSDEDRHRLVEEGHASAEEAAALQPGALWADGVLDGLDDLADLWQLPQDDDSFSETFAGIVDQVSALSVGPADEGWKQFLERYHGGRAPERDDLLTNACFAVQDLRLLLLDHGPKPETRRVAPQPGRNDPCPCGSGKKYKRCHGAGT